MPSPKLNPGDRLPWRKSPHWEPTQPRFIARPEGEGIAPFASVSFDATAPAQAAWSWGVGWPGRFGNRGVCGDRQAAADEATAAYWRCMAATVGWTLPAEPIEPPIIATLASLGDAELLAVKARYFTAVSRGDSGIESTKYRDEEVYKAAFAEAERRGLNPSLPLDQQRHGGPH